MNLVPIVYGGVNYSALLPERSFIDVRDFTTVKDLAMYLKYLAKNAEEYKTYLTWKGKYSHPKRSIDYCAICKYFQDSLNNQPRTVDAGSYWSVDTNCDDPHWNKEQVKDKGVLGMRQIQNLVTTGALPYRCQIKG